MKATQRKIFYSLILLILILIPIGVNAGNCPFYFEKGDLAYRELDLLSYPPTINAIGHTGIYGWWTKDTRVNPANHFLLQMEPDGGLKVDDFQLWIDTVGLGKIWGSRSLSSMTAYQRYLVVKNTKDILQNQFGGADYGGVPDVHDNSYKDPVGIYNLDHPGKPSFRCDGLTEYIYEIVLQEPWEPGSNLGLYTNDDVPQNLEDLKNYFNPLNQANSLRWDIVRTKYTKASPPQLTIKDSKGNKIPDGETTTDKNISVYATDTTYGSGLSLLEVWKGNPDSGGTLLKSFSDDYDVDHTYSSSNIGTLPDGDIYVRCFDQAGNDILHLAFFRFVNNSIGIQMPC